MPIAFIFTEVAAAEIAAAAAAEAAAAAAAETLAAQIAAEAGTAAAAQTAATTASAGPAGIMELGNAAANAGPLTADAVNAAAQQANAGIQGLPQGFDQQIQNIQNMSQGPSVQVASANPAAGLESLQNQQPVFQSGQNLPSAVTSPVTDGGITLPMGIDMPGTYMPPSNAVYTPPPSIYTATPPSALENGFNTAAKFAKENPFTAATLAYTGANALGLFKPSGETFGGESYDGPLSKYRLSPDFKAGNANPEDFQYTPRRYAEGGIMGTNPNTITVGYEQGGQMPEAQNYAKGGSLSDSIDSYQKMLSGKQMEPPASQTLVSRFGRDSFLVLIGLGRI